MVSSRGRFQLQENSTIEFFFRFFFSASFFPGNATKICFRSSHQCDSMEWYSSQWVLFKSTAYELGEFFSMSLICRTNLTLYCLGFLGFEIIFNKKVLALKATGMISVFSFVFFVSYMLKHNATSVIKLLPQQYVLPYVLWLFFLHYYELVLSMGFVNKCFCRKLWSGVFLVPHRLEALVKHLLSAVGDKFTFAFVTFT